MSMQRFYVKTQTPQGVVVFSVLAPDGETAASHAEKITRDKILSVRKENHLDAIGHSVGRFIIRTLRVLAGLALVFGAWLIFDSGSVADKPMSALTLADIGGAIGRTCIGFAIAAGGWFLAFEEGPVRDRLPPVR